MSVISKKIRPRRKQRSSLTIEALELRSLLSGLTVLWLGQQGLDEVGVGPNVGPDGFVDAEISLSGLSSTKAISLIHVSAQDGTAWEYGTNVEAVNNAEFIPNSSSPTIGTLFISPRADASMSGEALSLTVDYTDGTSDAASVVAGSVNPNLAVSPPAPIAISAGNISVQWMGQDGSNLGGTGAVHLALSNLPSGQTVVAGMLSDTAGNSWAFGSSNGVALTTTDPEAQPLSYQVGTSASTANMGFLPNRDETSTSMTLRFVLANGSSIYTTFVAGADNPSLREPNIASTVYDASPGDNLYTIVNDYGTVHLAAGIYDLDSTLVLNHPVTIIGAPGSELLFTQSTDSPDWTTAIKIHASNTTLEGFAVRFTGPITWAPNISYGPAVIGVTDNYDVGFNDPLINLTFEDLNLESPPAASSWEQAIGLFRLAYAQSGVIENNTLLGGTTEFLNGPWTISGNTYLGTMPDTYSYGVIAGHYTHDVQIVNNTIDGFAPSSKTWRFAVLTQEGINDVIANNTVTGIGPQDDDTVPNPNASETILTEAYRLHFEGTPSSISSDGMIVQIPYLQAQYDFARTGDVVAVLAGPDAGQWRLITQALTSTAFLLNQPLNPLDSAISISSGFVGLQVNGNLLDSVGSSTADDIALAGDLFGVTVMDNQIMGGKDAIWVDATPTEQPDIWGWSHAPVMGLTVQGNLVMDSIDGILINVEHGNGVKSNLGRLYLTGTVSNNLVIWTAAFLSQESANISTLTGFEIDDPLSIDPGEMRLSLGSNAYLAYPGQTSIPSYIVSSATINGNRMVAQSLPLTADDSVISSLKLVNNAGTASNGPITTDGLLSFDEASSTLSYLYSVTGLNGTYQPVVFSSGAIFLPAGLVHGTNNVFIKAVDGFGITRGTSSITFEYGSITPPATPQGLQLVEVTGGSAYDLITSNPTLGITTISSLTYEYSLTGATGSYSPIVFSANSTFQPYGLVQGLNTVFVRAVDSSGNRSTPVSIAFTYLFTNPPPPSSLQLAYDSGSSSSDSVTNQAQVRVGASSGVSYYEYSLSGNAGTYEPVVFDGAMTFLPLGIVQGTNTVFVKAVDPAGNQSVAAQLTFVYDTVPPGGVTSISLKSSGVVSFRPVAGAATYQYRIGPSSSYVDLGAATTFRVVSATSHPEVVFIRAVDVAGNVSLERSLLVRPMTSQAYQNMLRSLALKARRLAKSTHP